MLLQSLKKNLAITFCNSYNRRINNKKRGMKDRLTPNQIESFEDVELYVE